MNLEIPINSQSVLFKQHLDDSRNERIIFSGIFGIGKSYFLEKYFGAEKDDYVAINLRPINYSISNNEDIFRLIKYDILYELIFTQNLQLVVESVKKSIAYGVLLENKVQNLLESFLPLIPLLNKEAPDLSPLISFIKMFLPNISETETIRKDVNLNLRLEEFVKEIDKNYLFESDFITLFIERSLDSLCNKVDKQPKLKVLIIDDLDRIDPEHIFRLFNIFSAHLDYHKSTSNKFGFDKVIFVCDIDNIRNIFFTKYGVNVDFSGYIDKFYSTEIFHFNNNKAVASITNKIISKISFSNNQELIKEYILHNNLESTTNLLYVLLKALINSGTLNLRRIQSAYQRSFTFKVRHFFTIRKYDQVLNIHVPATIIFDILLWFFGNLDSLERGLQRLVTFGRNATQVDEINYEPNFSDHLGMLIPIIDFANHKFDVKDNYASNTIERALAIKINSKVIDLKYQLKYSSQRNYQIYHAELINFNYRDNTTIELFEFVHEAFRTLRSIHYF